jgi:hypothetical protein
MRQHDWSSFRATNDTCSSPALAPTKLAFMTSTVAALAAPSSGEPLSLTTIERRTPGPADVVIDIANAGICHSGMRLNEVAQHAWDVHVALTPNATLPAESAEILAEQLSGGLRFMPGFLGKHEALTTPAVVAIAGTEFGFVIGDDVALSSSVSSPTATFVGPLEAAIRLIGGRLKTGFTAADIEVTGSVTLDDLRRVFPGF